MAGTINQAALAAAGRVAIGAVYRSPEERLRMVIQAYVDAVDAGAFRMEQEFEDLRLRREYEEKQAKGKK